MVLRVRSSLYTNPLWILAGGRRSGPGDASLVRERAGTFSKNASSETPSSRTSEASPGPLLRPSGRSLAAFYSGRSRTYVYDERRT
ncbi:hypothetical protein B0F86_17985 [Pseudomonas syringae]|nr:hypothetical protein B0F86_17985 [Pseudomonas syringae]RXT62259.1 hypothetical protein B1F74_17880 [Pseudomonas syringae]